MAMQMEMDFVNESEEFDAIGNPSDELGVSVQLQSTCIPHLSDSPTLSNHPFSSFQTFALITRVHAFAKSGKTSQMHKTTDDGICFITELHNNFMTTYGRVDEGKLGKRDA